jgi:hypothetical protein
MPVLLVTFWVSFSATIGDILNGQDPSTATAVYCIAIITLAIWCIVDAVLLAGWVKKHNMKVIEKFENECK